MVVFVLALETVADEACEQNKTLDNHLRHLVLIALIADAGHLRRRLFLIAGKFGERIAGFLAAFVVSGLRAGQVIGIAAIGSYAKHFQQLADVRAPRGQLVGRDSRGRRLPTQLCEPLENYSYLGVSTHYALPRPAARNKFKRS